MKRPIDTGKLSGMDDYGFYSMPLKDLPPPREDPEPIDVRSFHDTPPDYEDPFAIPEGAWTGPKRKVITAPTPWELKVLGLELGCTFEQVKARYRELMKRYHPDTNNGDRSNEARMAEVQRAFESYKNG